jgi:hypothetical protein
MGYPIGSLMAAKRIPILFALLAGTMFASCSRENSVAPAANDDQNRGTSQATPQKPSGADPTEERKWAILTKADFPDEDSNPYDFKGIWEPSQSEVVAAIQAIRPYLAKQKKAPSPATGQVPADGGRKKIDDIVGNWDKYVCQAVGHTKSGKKLIHLNFFPKEDVGDSTNWLHRYVYGDDGGTWYWRIEYDCEAKTFSEFETNGDA